MFDLCALCSWKVVATIVALIAAVMYLKKPKKWVAPASHKAGTVYLHTMSRVTWNLNCSPFCVKLETFLRMANVKHEVVNGVEFSTKGKCPWIEYNGEQIPDSSLAIEFLKREFKLTIDDHLSATDRAVGHAFKVMCDENLYWAIVWTRWITNRDIGRYIGEIIPPIPKFMRGCVGRFIAKVNMAKSANGHGIGRHSNEEVYAICAKDCDALNDFIGSDKKFLFGDGISSFDAAVFASVSSLIWCPYESTITDHIKKNCPNLEPYCKRVRDAFWPDWNDYILPNGSKAFPK